MGYMGMLFYSTQGHIFYLLKGDHILMSPVLSAGLNFIRVPSTGCRVSIGVTRTNSDM